MQHENLTIDPPTTSTVVRRRLRAAATTALLAASLYAAASAPAPAVQAAQKIKHCGPAARAQMQSVLSFLQSNIETIMGDVNDLKTGEKRKLRRKVRNVNIKCMDHRRVCRRKASRGGIDRHLFNRAVVICYNNISTVAQSTAYCKLADVVLHEIAHSAGVKKQWGHNGGPNGDRVYRTGYAAEDLCIQQGLNGSIPLNTNN